MSQRICCLFTVVWALSGFSVFASAQPDRQAAAETHRDTQAESRPLKKWVKWDRAISRGSLARAYMQVMNSVEDPYGMYAKAITYRGEPDSLGLEDFRRLPVSEQLERRRLATKHLGRAQRFEVMIWDWVQYNKEGMSVVSSPGIIESTARFIGHLVTANGIDPSNPESWYDLTFFMGAFGDWPRYQAALDATWAAIGEDPLGIYRDLRHRICLDQAWFCRDQGRLEEGLEWVARADSIKREKEESYLIRGLLLGDLGRFQEACDLAVRIRSIKVKKPLWGVIPSDFAESWIQSMAYRAQGDMPLACFALGRVHTLNRIPYAHHYFNDVGLMCELNDQPAQARQYYAQAAIHRPFFSHYPVGTFVGPSRVHGQAGTGLPYTVAFDRFYIAGSLFSYGANLTMACEVESDLQTQAELGDAAIAALSACRRRQIRPTAAIALRGRVQFALENYVAAEADLALACEELAEQGVNDAGVCALAGVLMVRRDAHAEALPHLARAIKAQPDLQLAWSSLGIAASAGGNVATGRKAFDMSIELAPESAAARYNRGLLSFHQRRWTEACEDLEAAAKLAPADERITALLDRARKARERAKPVSGGEAIPPEPLGDEGQAPAFWQDFSPDAFASSHATQLDAVAAMYSDEPFGTLNGSASGRGNGRLDLSSEDLQQVVTVCELSFLSNPSRTNRRQLALAYVRSGDLQKGRDLLLPFWDRDIELAEMCVVLEADRALGDVDRASRFARSLANEPPGIEDPIFWSLVAFVCLDMGLNDEGLRALEAAITFDPDNVALKSQRQLLQRNLR